MLELLAKSTVDPSPTDVPTRDCSAWEIKQWYYNGFLYNSTETFRAAWQSPDFEKVQPNRDGDWTDIEDYSHGPPGREKPPPVMIQPSGPRYEVDRHENFVSWSMSSDDQQSPYLCSLIIFNSGV